jgi:hypothetical protein
MVSRYRWMVEEEEDIELTTVIESKAWQSNNTVTIDGTANATSTSEEDHQWTIFAPVTMVTAETLDVPEITTSSSVTQRAQLSLEVSESQPSATRTSSPKPIFQPSESSLLISVATVSDGKTYVTIAPSAHLEHSETILVRPEGGTATPTLGIVGSELVDLPANTGSVATRYDQGDSGSSAGSNGNVQQNSPGFIIIGNTPLSPGGSPITFQGNTYSLQPTGLAVVINGNTVSFSTNSRGQVLPVETATSGQSDNDTNDVNTESLDKLSVVSATATTATRDGAHETASATPTRMSENTGSPATKSSNTNNNDEDREATGTTTSDAPATQSDNAAAPIAAEWSLSAVLGAVGILAVI